MDASELNPTTKYERDAVTSYLHVHRAPHEVMSTAMPFLFRLIADVDRLEAENARLVTGLKKIAAALPPKEPTP